VRPWPFLPLARCGGAEPILDSDHLELPVGAGAFGRHLARRTQAARSPRRAARRGRARLASPSRLSAAFKEAAVLGAGARPPVTAWTLARHRRVGRQRGRGSRMEKHGNIMI
jgi:hypothetical protein